MELGKRRCCPTPRFTVVHTDWFGATKAVYLRQKRTVSNAQQYISRPANDVSGRQECLLSSQHSAASYSVKFYNPKGLANDEIAWRNLESLPRAMQDAVTLVKQSDPLLKFEVFTRLNRRRADASAGATESRI